MSMSSAKSLLSDLRRSPLYREMPEIKGIASGLRSQITRMSQNKELWALLAGVPPEQRILIEQMVSGNKAMKSVGGPVHAQLSTLYKHPSDIEQNPNNIVTIINSTIPTERDTIIGYYITAVIAAIANDGSMADVLGPLAPALKGWADSNVFQSNTNKLQNALQKTPVPVPSPSSVKSSLSNMRDAAQQAVSKMPGVATPAKPSDEDIEDDLQEMIDQVKASLTTGPRAIPPEAVPEVMKRVERQVKSLADTLRGLGPAQLDRMLARIGRWAVETTRARHRLLFEPDAEDIDPDVMTEVEEAVLDGIGRGSRSIGTVLHLIPADKNRDRILRSASNILEHQFSQEYSRYVTDNNINVDPNVVAKFVEAAFLALCFVLAGAKGKEAEQWMYKFTEFMDQTFKPWREFVSLEKISGMKGGRGYGISGRNAAAIYRRLHQTAVNMIRKSLASPMAFNLPNRGEWERLLQGGTLAQPVKVGQILGVGPTAGRYGIAEMMISEISRSSGGEINPETAARQLIDQCKIRAKSPAQWVTSTPPGQISKGDLMEGDEPKNLPQESDAADTEAGTFLNPEVIMMISTLLSALYNMYVGQGSRHTY